MGHRRGDSKTVPRVAIVGCGKIGSWLDEQGSADAVLSHAGAYQRSGLIRLVALCDTDKDRLAECGLRRDVSALYVDYRTMLQSERIDILSICTPTTQRLPILEAALESGIKVIFCEKPIAHGLEEARQMRLLANQHDAVVVINYSRRWDPGIHETAQLIKAGRIGQIQHITAYYDKGILNNGSHIIDLLNLFFGLPFRVKALRVIDDGYSSLDPTLDCVLEYEVESRHLPVYLVTSDYRHFSLFEIDIMGTAGRIRIAEKGQEIKQYSVGEDPIYRGYSVLRHFKSIPSDLKHVLGRAVEDLVDVYYGRSSQPRCGVEEAIDALRVVEALRKSLSSGSTVELTEI
jgi:predicted dehydrogenase